MLFEVVCCSVDDCVAAEAAGAWRIELCSAIELGGLTPTTALLALAKESVQIPILAMVRPRAGGFCYSSAEVELMLREAADLVAAGADGLVFGVLTQEGEVDVEICSRLVESAGGVRTMFHRAFDSVPDQFEALEALISAGYTAVMTCGQASDALEGAPRLRDLRERAGGRLEVVVAGGIRGDNCRAIAEITGTDQIHIGPFKELASSGYSGQSGVQLDIDDVKAVIGSLKS